MIRLAKAHARLRLSEKVEEEDVGSAISMMKSSLKSLGFSLDKKGAGKLEALETGKTRGQRKKINALWDIIEDLKEIYGEEIPVGEFKEEAEAEGISEDFVSDIFLKEELENKGNLAWTGLMVRDRNNEARIEGLPFFVMGVTKIYISSAFTFSVNSKLSSNFNFSIFTNLKNARIPIAKEAKPNNMK